MNGRLDRRAMATLSGGHGAVDFASGAVPALLPFLVERFDLSYTRDGGADARRARLVVAAPAAVRPLVGPPRRDVAPARRGRARRRRDRARVGRAELRARRRARSSSAGVGIAAYHPEGAKFAAFASGRKRASGMSYFNIGGNSGYALGADPDHAARASGSASTGGLLAMVPVVAFSLVLLACSRRCGVSRPDARRAAGGGRRGRRPGAWSLLVARDRAAERRVVRAARVRPAVDRRATAGPRAEGGRELALMLVSGRGRDARPRAGRRPGGAAAHAPRDADGAPAPDRRVRRRRRRRRHARADARRALRRRDVRGDDGARPALPPAARRAGERADRRARDGDRRDRRRRPRRRWPMPSTSRPRSTSPRPGRRSAPSCASSCRRPSYGGRRCRARAGRDRLRCPIERSVNEEAIA